MFRRTCGLALGLALSSFGCGSDEVRGCDLREADNRCQERTSEVDGISAAVSGTYEATCEASGGTYLSDGCPEDGRVLGCEISSGGAETVVDWYYAPETRATAEADCDGTVIEP